MPIISTHPAGSFLHLFPFLLEVGSIGDVVLFLGFVSIFLHHVGRIISLNSRSVFVLSTCLLFNIKRANEILNRKLMPLMFQRSG